MVSGYPLLNPELSLRRSVPAANRRPADPRFQQRSALPVVTEGAGRVVLRVLHVEQDSAGAAAEVEHPQHLDLGHHAAVADE